MIAGTQPAVARKLRVLLKTLILQGKTLVKVVPSRSTSLRRPSWYKMRLYDIIGSKMPLLVTR